MKTENKMENVVISESARGRMTDVLYSKIMKRVKSDRAVGKSLFGFKVSKINSAMILM